MSAYYSDIKYNYETSYKIDGVDYKLYIPRLPREDFEGMALEAVYDDVLKKDYKEVYDIFEKNKYSNFQEKVEGLVHAMKTVNGKHWNSSQYIWFYDNYFQKFFAVSPEPVYVPNLDYSSSTNKKSFDIQAMFEAIGDDSDEESSDENKSTNNEKVSATTIFPSAFDLLYPDGDESEDYSSPDESSSKPVEKMNEKELKKIKNAEQRKTNAEIRTLSKAAIKADRERSKAEAKSSNKLAKEQLKAVQKQEKQSAKDAIKASKQSAKDAIKASKQAEKETVKAKKISSQKNTGGSKKNRNQKNKMKRRTQKKI